MNAIVLSCKSFLVCSLLMDFNYFLSVLGLVLVIEGFPYFAFPEKFKKFLAYVSAIPDLYLRAYGLMAMVIGLLILFLVRGRINL